MNAQRTPPSLVAGSSLPAGSVSPGAGEGGSLDEVIERAIANAADDLATAPEREAKLAAMECLRSLHALRSPEQIARMERVRGLR